MAARNVQVRWTAAIVLNLSDKESPYTEDKVYHEKEIMPYLYVWSIKMRKETETKFVLSFLKDD